MCFKSLLQRDGLLQIPDENLKNLNEEANTKYKHVATHNTPKGPSTDQLK